MPGITFSEGSGLNNSVFGKSQAPIRMFIEKKGEALEQVSVVKQIFAMEKSKNYAEKITSLTAMEGFRPVGENGAHPIDSTQEGFEKTIEHMTWKDSFSISRELVDDSKVLDLRKKPTNFVNAFYRTREKFGAALFGAAIAGQKSTKFSGVEFNVQTADGKTLFAKDHPAKIKGKAQSNVFSNAFSVEALMAGQTAMQNFRGDNEEILDVAPNTILIPNDHLLKKEVFSVIGADKDPLTSNNGFSYVYGMWNVIVWPYLNQFIADGSKPWILLDTQYGEDYGGAVWYDRVELEVKSSIDENTNANVWRGYSRFSAGFADWRFAMAGGITGGTALF
jgi:hypothetical protein